MEPTSPLSYEQQSALLVDLKRGLHDPETAADTRTLLVGLRKRRDLYAAVAEQIDEMLGSPGQAPSAPHRASPLEPPREADTFATHGHASFASSRPQHDLAREGWVHFSAPLLGWRVGAFILVVTDASWEKDLPFGAAIVGAAGAIAGAISGTRWRVILIAVAGAILAFGVWAIMERHYVWGFVRAGIFGAAIGAILGAIAGAIMAKKKG